MIYNVLLISAVGECTLSRPTLCDPADYSPTGSSVHGTFQARRLEWVAISFSKFLLYSKVIHLSVCTHSFLHILFHCGLSQDIEYSSRCCMLRPVVHPLCMYSFVPAHPELPVHPFPTSPLTNTGLLSMSVSPFLFCR